mmetsp:Transcript_43752/g.139465  ORF Transcript_43752/g.139465 Transcript_43752/m.139465 type:complete len:165 (-) Transcript_43752:666-1160(-)
MEIERMGHDLARKERMPQAGLLSMRLGACPAPVVGPQPMKGLASGLQRMFKVQSMPCDMPAYRPGGSGAEFEIQNIMLRASPVGSPGTLRATLGFSPPARSGNPLINDSRWRSTARDVSYSNLAELEARGVARPGSSPLRTLLAGDKIDPIGGILQFSDEGDFC